MKKIIFSICSIFFYCVATAQSGQLINLNHEEKPSFSDFAIVSKAINQFEDTLHFDEESTSNIGFLASFSEAGAYIKLSSGMLKDYVGKKILKLYFNLANVELVTEAEIRIYEISTSDSIPENHSLSAYKQPFVAQGTGSMGAWNLIELNTPFTINENKSIFIGHHLKVSGASGFCVVWGTDSLIDAPKGNNFIYLNQWADCPFSSNLSIRAIVEHVETAIGEQEIKPISVYPNPAKEFVNIEGVNVKKAEIYNLFGAKISSYENKNTLNVSNLENGIYLLNIVSDKNIKSFIKLNVVK